MMDQTNNSLQAQIDTVRAKLRAQELINGELKQQLAERSSKDDSIVFVHALSPPVETEKREWKVEAKDVLIDQLKGELRRSSESLRVLEEASAESELTILRQINLAQEEKIINLSNELHAKKRKIAGLKSELETRMKEETDVGRQLELEEKITKQQEKITTLKTKYESFKEKVAVYRQKKATERLEHEKENTDLVEKIIQQLTAKNEEINDVGRELGTKQAELERLRVREAEALSVLKQNAENEDIISRLNQKQQEINKLKLEKEELMNTFAFIEDQSAVSKLTEDLEATTKEINQYAKQIEEKDQMIEMISLQLARDMNSLIDEMTNFKIQKAEELNTKNAEIETLQQAILKHQQRRRRSTTSDTEPSLSPDSAAALSNQAGSTPPKSEGRTRKSSTTTSTSASNTTTTSSSMGGLLSGWFTG